MNENSRFNSIYDPVAEKISMKHLAVQTFALLFLIAAHAPNLCGQWVQTNGPFGGDVRVLLAAPSNTGDTCVYAATFGSAIFRSSNQGMSWKAANNGINSPRIESMACGVDNSGLVHLYAGTTSPLAGVERGIYASTNDGESWTLIHREEAKAIAAWPNEMGSDMNILASTTRGVDRSTNNGKTWSNVIGHWREERCRALLVLRGEDDSTVALAAFDGNGMGIYRSLDHGATWTKVDRGVYSALAAGLNDAGGTNVYAAGLYGGTTLSTDFGQTWVSMADSGMTGVVTALFCRGDTVFAGTGKGFFVSVDGGTYWRNIAPNGPATQYNAIVSVGRNLVIGGKERGLYRTTNLGGMWFVSNQGLAGTSISALTVNGNTLFAGTQEHGFYRSTDFGERWEKIDSTLPDKIILASASSDGKVFVGPEASGVFRSTDNGMTWTAVNNGLPGSRVSALISIPGDSLSMPVLCALANDGVALTTNNGESWSRHESMSRLDISALSPAGRILYAGTGSGVLRSSDYGVQWDSTNFGNYGVRTIGASRSTVVAVTSDGGIVRYSTDEGNSWDFKIGGDVHCTLLYSATPASDSVDIFAGSYGYGVYLLKHGDKYPSQVSHGLINPYVYLLKVCGRYLFCGTPGAGIWRRPLSEMVHFIEVSSEIVPPPMLPDQTDLHPNYPNPVTGLSVIRYDIARSDNISLLVLDVLGRRVATLVDGFVEPGSYRISFDASSLPSGQYYAVLLGGGMVKSIVMTVMK